MRFAVWARRKWGRNRGTGVGGIHSRETRRRGVMRDHIQRIGRKSLPFALPAAIIAALILAIALGVHRVRAQPTGVTYEENGPGARNPVTFANSASNRTSVSGTIQLNRLPWPHVAPVNQAS